MKTQKKTNVLRLLDQARIAYESFAYSVSDGRTDAVSVAEKLNVPAEQVYKTLVTVSDGPAYFVFVIPAAGTLDLKAAARAAAVKSLEMLPQAKLLPLTGYVHGGCSPVGMKKPFPTFFDASAQSLSEIFVSAGKVGMNVRVSSAELAAYTGAQFANVSKDTKVR